MILRIADITIVRYGEANVLCEPSSDEIKQAIETNQLEARGFQADLDELKAEWIKGSHGGRDLEEWCRLVKDYHARRIAHFAVNGWEDPIKAGPGILCHFKSLLGNGCPGWDRTSDQVINSYLLRLLFDVCI
jgi:hypothetical protein